MSALVVVEALSPYFTCSLAPLSFQPVAAGSGIPQIKCFLNGVKIPHVVRLKVRCAVRQGRARDFCFRRLSLSLLDPSPHLAQGCASESGKSCTLPALSSTGV